MISFFFFLAVSTCVLVFADTFYCCNCSEKMLCGCALAMLLRLLPSFTALTLHFFCWHLAVDLLAADFFSLSTAFPSCLQPALCIVLAAAFSYRRAATLFPLALQLHMDLCPSPLCCFSPFCTAWFFPTNGPLLILAYTDLLLPGACWEFSCAVTTFTLHPLLSILLLFQMSSFGIVCSTFFLQTNGDQIFNRWRTSFLFAAQDTEPVLILGSRPLPCSSVSLWYLFL